MRIAALLLLVIDVTLAIGGFFYAMYLAYAGEYAKAAFWMALATNCELGIRMRRLDAKP